MAIQDLFKNLFDVKNILNPLSKNVVGIDIGSSSIKIVELEKKKGRAVLKTYGEIALGPYGGAAVGQVVNLNTERTSEALHDILKEARASTPNSGMAIPFKSSLISLIEMPALPEKQLEEAIPIEARKYIPVPISEITLDWWIIPKDDTRIDRRSTNDQSTDQSQTVKEKNDVLVVSIHNEILNDYNNIVKTNNLNTSFFEIEMFSASRALVEDEKDTLMILDMGASGTKLYVIHRGVLRNSHIINKGSKDVTSTIARSLSISDEEAEKIKRNIANLEEADRKSVNDMISLTVDGILAETENFINNFHHRSGHQIKKIILTGGGVAQSGFRELVEKKFKTEVSVGNPFSKVDAPKVLAETLKSTGLEFAVAVGIALRKMQELQ
jgi:type IV pilus assembly protein PilM